MECISWNVDDLQAAVKKSFMDVLNKLDTDFFCLQETKLQTGQIDLGLPGYHQYWNYAERKGYSGTAIFTKEEALGVRHGLGIEAHDQEDRVVTLEYPEFFIVTCYTPNSRTELKRLTYRMTWEDTFSAYLNELNQERPVIPCDGLNIAHQNIDLRDWKTNQKNAEFTPEERQKFAELLDSGFTDTSRYFYPETEDIYSQWGYRFNARKNNASWRTDYFVMSGSLNKRLISVKVRTDILSSDHCPAEVMLDF